MSKYKSFIRFRLSARFLLQAVIVIFNPKPTLQKMERDIELIKKGKEGE